MNERRKYPRFELKLDAKYIPVDSRDVYKGSRTRDVSAEGICFESGKPFNKGEYVSLEVDLGDKMSPVSLVGEIRWSQEIKSPKLKEKRFINGVKLVDIPKSEEGRFLRYYCDRMVEKLADYLKM